MTAHRDDDPRPPLPGPGEDLGELWDWRARHAAPRTDDDTPILIGSGGRRATREEIIAVLAEAEARGEAERA